MIIFSHKVNDVVELGSKLNTIHGFLITCV